MRHCANVLARMSSNMTKVPQVPISSLPLPSKSHILTQNLSCDPKTPPPLVSSPNTSTDTDKTKTFLSVLKETPSIMRRARIVAPQTHFSHVSPLNLPFPYRIEQPPEDVEVEDQAEWVEQWLSEREPLEERSVASAQTLSDVVKSGLKKYSRETRDATERDLIALSDTALRECLPHLDVGDAFDVIGTPSLSIPESAEEVDIGIGNDQAKKEIRQELVDVLTGHSVLMNLDGKEGVPYAPWSLRYGGHQFGTWAGQLGDGRAISILETPHPSDADLIYELQLKGAGRTPYSRTADGLAVLRSSIREYLCSEAMNALSIPTTRALSLVHLPTLPVSRETTETACVLTRLAPSFLRIGSFQALNPPQNVFFLSLGMMGGGGGEKDLEAMRILGEWVVKRVLKVDLGGKQVGEVKWARELVLECARRNAEMVAKWQVYGFMHGVINTDNVSIMGLTIDYGPYAFMDIYHENHICNHSDEEGRYSYKLQPTMIQFALKSLLEALAPLIGAESELGHGVPPNYFALPADAGGNAKEEMKEKIERLSKLGMGMEGEVKELIERVVLNGWEDGFRKRLGLKKEETSDAKELIHPLLELMQSRKLDFHSTFRTLCAFRPFDEEATNAFIAKLAINSHEASPEDQKLKSDWKAWLTRYGTRIQKEVDEGLWTENETSQQTPISSNGIGLGRPGKEETNEWKAWDVRDKRMRLVNPRFVLRQWVLEEIIARVRDDPGTGKRALAKVHQMATRPYDAWGAEDDGRKEDELSEEEREERRFCGLGAKRFVGFQCSCSS